MARQFTGSSFEHMGQGQQASVEDAARRFQAHRDQPSDTWLQSLGKGGQQILDVPSYGLDALNFVTRPIFAPQEQALSNATGGVVSPDEAGTALMGLAPKGGMRPMPRVAPEGPRGPPGEPPAGSSEPPDVAPEPIAARPSRNVTQGVLSDADVMELPPEAGGEPAPKQMDMFEDIHETPTKGALSDEDVFGKWFGEQSPEPTAPGPSSSFRERFGDNNAPLPESLTPEALSDDLFRIKQSRPADMAEIQQNLDTMPAEAKNPAVQERMFRYGEGDPSVKLAPQEQAAFDSHIQPMRDELSQLYAKIYEANHGVELPGLEDVVHGEPYMHRIAKGRAPQFDELEGAASADPVYGTRQLSRKPSPMQARSVFTVENAKGTRKVVTVAPEGVYIWNRGERVRLPGVNPGDIKVGESVPILDQTWDVKSARSQEVHEHTPIKYHRNAFANTAEALVRMRAAARAVDMLERITKMPEWSQIARPLKANGTPADWRTPKLPQLREWRMRPDIADVFDDFVGKDLSKWEQGLANVNRVAVGSIFWNPIPHIENVATHWLVGRGWDNFMPKGLSRLAKTMPRAVMEVVTQGPKYRQMLKEGGGLIYGSVANRDFYGAMMKKLGQQIEAHPDNWTPIVKTLGFTGVPQFLRGWYRASSKALWSVGDMMMMQRYLENEAKGMSAREAIKEAEKHIPNYRIPTKVLGSRGWSQFLQNPAFDMFSRYHYGQFKSYANILKDFYKGTPAQKLDAAGNVFTMAVLMAAVYPALDYAIQQATGQKEARKLRRGALSVPDSLLQLYNGDKEFPELMGQTITMTPAVTMAGELYKNKDFFTGNDIVNSGGDPGRGASQIAEYLMQKMVSPYQTGVQAWKDVQGGKPGEAAARVVLRQLGGYQNPSPRSLRNKQRQRVFDRKDELSRLRHPRGPIESGYEALRRKSAEPKEQSYKGPQ